jgi:eukaryotic-like serine/threonine-protein kinase
MPQSGARLGPYEILSPLGAGGMGEVYKARDTRLDRTVAIKILPEALAADPQFRERFDREARTISQLDHPHICTLHDVGEHDGTSYLVMQYLEGETLEDRLKKGAIPLEQALQCAIQIADALASAHKAGIVHRDLKPGNIMFTKGGAKLLDFGLAKVRTSIVAGAGVSMLPTTPPNLTVQGTILGTFQYMAPEQLEGQEADARADIFAFGAVLYEMVTGRKAFTGHTQVSLLSSILKDEPPPISTVQGVVPPALDLVVRKCLAKSPDQRWQSARDLVTQLEWIAQGGSLAVAAPPAASRSRARERAAWAAAVTMAAVAIGLAALYVGRTPQLPGAVRFQIPPPAGKIFQSDVATALQPASPDGRRIVLTVSSGGQNVLALRSLDALQLQILAGTDGALAPFWSPDNRSVGFFAQGKLKKIDVTGGPPQTIASATHRREANGRSRPTVADSHGGGRTGRRSTSSAPIGN